MVDRKTAADRQHDRLIAGIETRSRRRVIALELPESDLRRAARSLAARAEAITTRRDRDPVLRAAADSEAAHCRRLAEALEFAVSEAPR